MSEPYEQKKGWSQEDFAFECRLHRNYIGPIERGERNISIE
ncbi:MAG: helix-turn-helix transcriptional regulator, partial [Pseudomonadota bacterium]|nr:helix-turn-helix transcriptional regulator [Pseudomonadota bacterium]